MEAPPPPTALSVSAIALSNYPDSVSSSPRSRCTDSWDVDPPPPAPPQKLRLMCSYGGHIVPRPHDKSLCYVGGDTRIIVIDRNSSLSDFHIRLSKTLLHDQPFSLKYQLPNEDLDSLISVATEEDLENMVEEYDRLCNSDGGLKNGRLRLFLFPKSLRIEQILVEAGSTKSEDWFLSALNGGKAATLAVAGNDRGLSESSSVNCLLGLDDNLLGKSEVVLKDVEAQIQDSKGSVVTQDAHSVPDSPMLDTSSSFGSTSSSPSMVNLPPIRVEVAENPRDKVLGVDEQFQQMNVGSVGVEGTVNLPQQKQEELGDFVAAAVAAGTTVTGLPAVVIGGDYANLVFSKVLGVDEQFQRMNVGSVGVEGTVNLPQQKQEEVGDFVAAGVAAGTTVSGLPAVVVGGDYANLVFSDDERSDHGGYRKAQAQQIQQPMSLQLQPHQIPQFQQKQAGAFDLASPDSVSSEGSVAYSLPRQTQVIYQEPNAEIQPGNNKVTANLADLKTGDQNNNRVQMQPQIQESGYVISGPFTQNHPQLHLSQQFIHPGMQYIPAGAVPMASYYPIYPSQQQHHPHQPILDQQYPIYFVPVRPTQAYNLPMQTPNYSELGPAAPILPQTTPPTSNAQVTAYNQARNAPSQPEMASGMYRTTTAPSQLVQVPSSQHQSQYAGFTQIHHHLSQSMVPSAAGNSTYAFDPTLAHVHGNQPVQPHLAIQYQILASASSVVSPEASTQLPTESIKPQTRTSQP